MKIKLTQKHRKLWTKTEPYASEYLSEYAAVQRFYREYENRWPLLTISLYYPWHGDIHGIKISVDKKDSKNGWWCECSLPKELISELVEMLQEIGNK